MIEALARNWWMVALRGVAAILFGILAIIWPDITVGVLVAFFGAYALVDGVFAIVAAFQADDTDRWWHVAEGVLGILVGIIAWVWPGLTALSLLYFIAAWALVTGVFEIIAAIRLRQQITNEWLLILGGVLSVLFGILLLFRPRESAIALVTVIGIYAIIFGGILLGLAFRLRGMRGDRGLQGGDQAQAAGPA
jgi:uncharacterized membrane protein HdeD (DUF308 family)